MIRWTHVAAAFALGAGLTAAGAAPAQTQSGNAAPAAATAQPVPPSAQSTQLPIKPSDPEAIKPWDPNANQPVYAVPPPPDGSSGIYLPAVVGGYAKSVAGCVLVGCNDGPQVSGAPAPSRPDEPPPQTRVNPGPSDPH
jgi:hypothetical protein